MIFDKQKALKNKEKYYSKLADKISAIFFGTIYQPILDILKEELGHSWIENAKDSLYKALIEGRIQYIDGHFEGKFNSILSIEARKIGAKFNKVKKVWVLPNAKLPMDLRDAIAQNQMKLKVVHSRINNFLSELKDLYDRIGENVFNINEDFSKEVNDLETTFKDGIEKITIAPEFTPEMADNLVSDYVKNMNLYIKDWTYQSIERLRNKVASNSFDGYRAENLIDSIRADYNTSENKAKFLARQETSLLMSKFREERYKSAGVQKYKWSTSHDSRVRDRHKELDGKIFTWDNPPIVDAKTGRRAHAGEDFGCRCVAIPILD